MKKITITLLFLVGAISLKAQDYIPLVVEGKQWNVVLTYVPWPPINRVTDVYKMEGDTMVEGTVYKKLFTTQSEQYANWELCGILRETDEGQVFYRKYRWSHTFEGESMLYDFSIQPGDSICYFDSSCLLLLSKNDTILDDGTVRKRYDFQYKQGGYLMDVRETWVEGIGSELGLLHSGSRFLVGGTYDLLCYYENEDLVWQNPDFNSCYLNTLIVNENEIHSISIHPNPTTSLVTVTGENLRQAEVVDLLGQQVISTQGKGDEIQINMSALPAGIYFVNVTDEDGRKCMRKVVKE